MQNMLFSHSPTAIGIQLANRSPENREYDHHHPTSRINRINSGVMMMTDDCHNHPPRTAVQVTNSFSHHTIT